MALNEISDFSGDELPRKSGPLPLVPAANDIETIFCPGDRLGGYEIEKVLGIGSCAVVYGALQITDRRHVALKVPLNRLNRHQDFTGHFEREAPRIAALSHPNLVNLLDYGHHADQHYFVLDYVEGVPLETAIIRGILSYGDYLAVVRQVREALKYVHGEGMAHLDVKPSNIFLSRNGQVKVGDFCVAHMALALDGTEAPEDPHRAPELRTGYRAADARADVYSLGITYHRMFSRAFPENGVVRATLLNPALPKAVDGVLQEAIAPAPDDRYESVQKFTGELLASLMGMAAFFQIDQIAEESEQATDEVVPVKTPAADVAPSVPVEAPVEVMTPAVKKPPLPVMGFDPLTPVRILDENTDARYYDEDTGSGPMPVVKPHSGKARVWGAAAIMILGFGMAGYLAFFDKSSPTRSNSAAPAAAIAAAGKGAATRSATSALAPGLFPGVLAGWLPSSHPDVQKALEAGEPVAIYFRREGSLAWADFEANVLGSEPVLQKLGPVVRAVEDLGGEDRPLVRRYGKGDERVLTVVGRHGRSIARFNADTNADQITYALSLM